MTPRERVFTSLRWEEPDRVPVQIYTTPEIDAQLRARFPGRDYLEVLGVDLRSIDLKYEGPVKPPRGNVFYDLWGTGYAWVDHGRGGAYKESVELPLARLETMDDVENYPWPDPDAFNYDAINDQIDRYRDYVVCLGSPSYPDILNGVSRGRGMEQVMIDIATGDEVGLAIIDKRVEFCYRVLRRGLETAKGRIDILHVGEDCGHQGGRMFSPDVFDRFFKPRLKRFYDLAHEFGALAMMHSCGDTSQIQPTFIDMGLDILDAMQPEPPGMDVIAMREACRGKLAFCGLISTQQTLPFGSQEECRAEARHRLDVVARGGGYIFAPAHCIQADTPIENVLAVYEEALGEKLT